MPIDPARTHILIVEDEPALAKVVEEYLNASDMDVTVLNAGTHAVEQALTGHHDLIVLDLMLPGKDGLTICREVRQTSTIPIILVTAKAEEIDRLLGLEMGADDYLCKPFSPRELVARVKAILRRTKQGTQKQPQESAHRFVIDGERWVAMYDGKPVDLTRREFRLLEILHNRPGRVFSRSQLLDLAFPNDSDVIDRTIDSHIKNIRFKIKAVANWDPIRSIYGVGYAFDD